jgi:pyridoxine 5-phosphate synthase
VSLFIEPDSAQVRLSSELGADAVELHTGRYCDATQSRFGRSSGRIEKSEYKRIVDAIRTGNEVGIHVHAGHGFDLKNVRKIAALDSVEEFNIGHSIVCRAAMVGLEQAVREMLAAIHAP